MDLSDTLKIYGLVLRGIRWTSPLAKKGFFTCEMRIGLSNLFLTLNAGILLTVNGTPNTRSGPPLKKQLSSADDGRKLRERMGQRPGVERRDGSESLVKRELDRDIDCLPDDPEDMRWRREDWNKDMMQALKQDPIIARQEDFERWLRKRGNAVVEQDPEAARVASKQAELQELLQQLYEAQAAVKMETGEVSRTQQVAQEAQNILEEATNKVRMLSADLQSAQEGAAAAAMRAHTAQLQLSAHDQLMFTARQRVDALSAQMVSVQAELAAAQQIFTLNNSSHLLEAQGRALEPSFMQEKMMPRPLPSQRVIYGPESIAGQPISLAGSPVSGILDEKHMDGVPSLPSGVNRQNYNYIYPQ